MHRQGISYSMTMLEVLRKQFGKLQQVEELLDLCDARQLRALAETGIRLVLLEAASRHLALDGSPDAEARITQAGRQAARVADQSRIASGEDDYDE
jgi:hypothetical protein